VVAVTGASTLEQVMEVLAAKGLHRVYVVDAAKKPLSIITLTDVLRLVTKGETKAATQRVVEMEEDDEDEDEE
jgi:CBS domain-containing protein